MPRIPASRSRPHELVLALVLVPVLGAAADVLLGTRYMYLPLSADGRGLDTKSFSIAESRPASPPPAAHASLFSLSPSLPLPFPLPLPLVFLFQYLIFDGLTTI